MLTDAHCHVTGEGVRRFVCARPDAPPMRASGSLVPFYGFHPWDAVDATPDAMSLLRERLGSDPRAGVGEIGLDRLRSREITDAMRCAFAAQLGIAAEFSRPVVLHGAKCWGQVVAACRPYAGRIPAFLFHGFSRSPGLLDDMAKMNGFVSVGPAVLNLHAVNYRKLVVQLPREMLLAETDATEENAAELPPLERIVAEIAALRGETPEEIARLTNLNACRFAGFSAATAEFLV